MDSQDVGGVEKAKERYLIRHLDVKNPGNCENREKQNKVDTICTVCVCTLKYI